MVAFLRWSRTIALSALNSFAKFVLFLIIGIVLLLIIGLMQGDGLPSNNIILSLDMRKNMPDSAPASPFEFGAGQLTVINVVLALDEAARDSRVKGVIMRVGSSSTSIAEAEEVGAALRRFREAGKFVIAHSQGFMSAGMGDYLLATAADEIWMQPKSPFAVSGAAAGGIFLRGFFDKIAAEPQIAKRADYKSAADMFMEKSMTPADREQLTALLQSWYGSVTSQVAAARNLTAPAVAAAFEKSPQFTEDAKSAKLIDRVGYDDDAYNAGKARAGSGVKRVPMSQYVRAKSEKWRNNDNARIALIQASGEISDGSVQPDVLGRSEGIGGDDLARAIRQAVEDDNIKAILLRIDSPGGSVSASDQILDAVKKARAKGKPVVVSMGSVAASGGYYVSASADRIVAQPGTITGSIGVLTGKVAIGKSLGLLGIGAEELNVGKNAGMDSSITPYTPEQWAAVNRTADVIYDDFTKKVASGRKLPLPQVQAIAKGRIWSGSDAKARGLVDTLGGFWTAASILKPAAGLGPTDTVAFKVFPREKGFFALLDEAFGGSSDSVNALKTLVSLMQTPFFKSLAGAANEMPRDRIEMRATNLPD